MNLNKILARIIGALFVVLIFGVLSLKISRNILESAEKELKKEEFIAATNNKQILSNKEAVERDN
jgi:hypothetical protein